jgi:hypothetical protein
MKMISTVVAVLVLSGCAGMQHRADGRFGHIIVDGEVHVLFEYPNTLTCAIDRDSSQMHVRKYMTCDAVRTKTVLPISTTITPPSGLPTITRFKDLRMCTMYRTELAKRSVEAAVSDCVE